MTRISFIMPSYNRADYIAESVQSVLAQMAGEDELVVVDDGSTDATEASLRPFADRLRYVRQENAGKSVALNRGMQMTDGAFVWICDDDDLLLPGVVEALLKTLETDQADVAFGRYTRFRHEGGARVDLGTGYWPDLTEGSLVRHILEDAFVMHNAAIVRRASYDQAGPFDPAMLRSQDYEMFVRLALQSRVSYLDTLIFEQRKHDGARGPARISHRAGRSEQVWEKYDRRIFERLRRHVPIDFFAGMFAAETPDRQRRAALLQRGCIMGRHGLWDEALDDFEAAANVAPNLALCPLEQQIVRRTVAGKHGFSGLLLPAVYLRAKTLGRAGTVGQAIHGQLARGMLWRLRGDDPVARADSVRFLRRPSTLLALAMQQAGSRSVASECSGLTELREPAPLNPATAALLASEIVA